VTNQRAQLDSAATTIDELVARIGASAEHHEDAGEVDAANDLYDVERSLRAAHRRLLNVVRRLDRG
jgi:hypothetical protein